MFEYLIPIILSAVVSIVPIPAILKNILKKYNETNKINLKLNNSDENSVELTLSKSNFESLINSVSAISENEKPENLPSTSSTPNNKTPDNKPPNSHFESIYISKLNTLKELNEKREIDKFFKKISFILAVVMSIAGTIILFTGIIICLFTATELGWITVSSGAIIELVAVIYFWLLNRTMNEVKDNSKQLEKAEDLLTAIELINKISDTKTKDETYRNIIETLLSK